VHRRGRGKDLEDVGDRQMRRMKHNLVQDFEAALSKTCPDDVEEGFRLLQDSQRFQSRFERGLMYRFEQHDKVRMQLVKLFKSSLLKKNAAEARYILSLYSPFTTREATMQLFECTEHQVKQANVYHRLRNIPQPVVKAGVSMLRKETVQHLEDFAFKADNLMSQPYSPGQLPRFLLFMNRKRLYLKYKDDCLVKCIKKPMGITSFYKFYASKIFKMMTQQTCCCTQCIENGVGSKTLLTNLIQEAFQSSPDKAKMYMDSLDNMERFYDCYYRGMLKRSSDDSNLCMTFALSSREEPCFRSVCNHVHTAKCLVVQQDVGFFHSLRDDISVLSKGEDLANHLWMLERAHDLFKR
jgi:hypothetical protein